MSVPTRPGDIPHDASLGVLAGGCSHHVEALVEHARGLHPLPDPEVAEHALAALSCGRAVADLVESVRWSTAVYALIAGAELERTAAAMGVDVTYLQLGLSRWIAQQFWLKLVEVEHYERVIDLLWEERP